MRTQLTEEEHAKCVFLDMVMGIYIDKGRAQIVVASTNINYSWFDYLDMIGAARFKTPEEAIMAVASMQGQWRDGAGKAWQELFEEFDIALLTTAPLA